MTNDSVGMTPVDDVRKEHGTGTPNEKLHAGVWPRSIPTDETVSDPVTQYGAAAMAASACGSTYQGEEGKASGLHGDHDAHQNGGKLAGK